MVGQPAPAGTGQLDAVTCAGPTHCWAVGAPGSSGATATTSSVPPSPATVIDATVDGGKTWAAQSLTLTPAPALTAISCPSVRLCMAVGLSASGTAGVVVTTGDGGATWAQASVPAGAIVVTSVVCASAIDCTAIASDGTTFWSAHSSDFGQTWTREGDLPPGFLDAGNLSCVAGAACLVTGYTATAAGHGQGAIAISTDGGVTWAAAVVPAGTGLLQSAVCATIASCLAVGTTSTTVSAVVPAHGALSHQRRRRAHVGRCGGPRTHRRHLRDRLPVPVDLRHGGDELDRHTGCRHRGGGAQQRWGGRLHRLGDRVHAAGPDRVVLPDHAALCRGRWRHRRPDHAPGPHVLDPGRARFSRVIGP